jgi:spore coat polysaccharide biosynthesis protein SpsF
VNIPAFITVRCSSRRLPQKCLLPFGKWNIIEHIINRAKHYNLDPIICTSTHPTDDLLEEIANKEDVKVFRGSLLNKLKRWYDCSNHFNIEKFHIVEADDPFFDGVLIKQSMELLDSGYDVVCPTESSSEGDASVGYSLSREIIEKALEFINDEEDTEMMWYYLDRVKNIKKIILANPNKKPCKVRLTLDYEEDYWLLESVRKMVGNLAKRSEVDELFISNPDLYKINWFRNEEWKAGQTNNII